MKHGKIETAGLILIGVGDVVMQVGAKLAKRRLIERVPVRSAETDVHFQSNSAIDAQA